MVARPRAATWLARLVAVYLGFVLLVWAVLYVAADRWWVATLLLFGPRWLCGAPLLALVPVALATQRRLLVPLAVAGLVVTFPILGLQVPLKNPFRDAPRGDLRVMTYNVGGGTIGAEALRVLVERVEPDVVTLQECGAFEQRLPRLFPAWNIRTNQGTCFLSRFPIVRSFERDRHDIWAMNGSGCIDRYEVETPRGIVSVQNVHLATVRGGLTEVIRRLWRGAPALRANIEQRAHESRVARSWAEQASVPSLVAGDFNIPVDSAVYRASWSGFTNAFSDAGFGFGTTKDTRWFGIRIDHVLASDAWECLGARSETPIGGDHRPVVVDLRLR
jgi:vancomycin resistance protein VanJ